MKLFADKASVKEIDWLLKKYHGCIETFGLSLSCEGMMYQTCPGVTSQLNHLCELFFIQNRSRTRNIGPYCTHFQNVTLGLKRTKHELVKSLT